MKEWGFLGAPPLDPGVKGWKTTFAGGIQRGGSPPFGKLAFRGEYEAGRVFAANMQTYTPSSPHPPSQDRKTRKRRKKRNCWRKKKEKVEWERVGRGDEADIPRPRAMEKRGIIGRQLAGVGEKVATPEGR